VQDDHNDSVKTLLTRHLAGETSPEEEKELQAWVRQSAENERQYSEFKRVFELSVKLYAQKMGEDLPINIDREWNHFITTVHNASVNAVKLQSPANRIWLKIAASLLIVIMSGFVVNYFLRDNKDVVYQTTGNTLNVTLPDGSDVILNTYSKLSYASSFGREDRTVTLAGEGFFNIVRNPLKHFIIKAKDAKVQVLGTSFNVRAYDSLQAIEVVVQSGVVGLSVPRLKTEIKLEAGQKGIYSAQNNRLAGRSNDDPNFISWNTHKITFNETDLRTVVDVLNKTYHANIVLATDVPAVCVVTVSFDNQSIDAVLTVLKTTLNLTYRINGNQIEITHAGC
jgi:transmembrane sensor